MYSVPRARFESAIPFFSRAIESRGASTTTGDESETARRELGHFQT
jgi:hypothetical protein